MVTVSRSGSSPTAAATAASRTAPSSVVTAASRTPARADDSRTTWSLTSSPTWSSARTRSRTSGRTRANSTAAGPRWSERRSRSPRPAPSLLGLAGDVIDDLVEERRELPGGPGPGDQHDGHRGGRQDDQGVLRSGLTGFGHPGPTSPACRQEQQARPLKLRDQPGPGEHVQAEHLLTSFLLAAPVRVSATTGWSPPRPAPR